MLSTVCFRLCSRNSNHHFTTTASVLSKHQQSCPRSQSIGKPHAVAPPLSNLLLHTQTQRQPRKNSAVEAETCNLPSLSFLKRIHYSYNSSSEDESHEVTCVTKRHGDHHLNLSRGESSATIWKSICRSTSLPRRSLSEPNLQRFGFSSPVSTIRVSQASSGGHSHGSLTSLALPHSNSRGLGRFALASSLLDGSWNVAWDARPARWLHGRYSAWLLFGVCNCFSAISPLPNLSPSALSCVHGNTDVEHPLAFSNEAGAALQQKQTHVGYTVTGIPGDGRCLFRAIAYGACRRDGKPTLSDDLQQDLADDLRNEVVDELVRRRSESEWFIEEEFDTYVKRMREPYVWGGEPELLMASHVLKMPITVHLQDKSSGELISVAEYGLEYGRKNPIRVLYHGFGHYDALQFEGEGNQ